MIEQERICFLNENKPANGDYVLYWMQASQRSQYNHALELAIEKANDLNTTLIVMFAIIDDYPSANLRHYHFMLEGLQQTQQELFKRGINVVIEQDSPDKATIGWAKKACVVVTDRGYLAIQKKWRKKAADAIKCPLIQVESDVIVPVEQAFGKEAYSAASLRPHINKQLQNYLTALPKKQLKKPSAKLKLPSFDISNIDKALSQLSIDRTVAKVNTFEGGTSQAKKLLSRFIRDKLDVYADQKNDPNAEAVSGMSPYLHFGQISPLYIALQIQKAKCSPQSKDAYLEELIVRRELAINFVHYNSAYDKFACLPNWVKGNFRTHAKDKRQYTYTLKQLEDAQTHDVYWNAAQMQMIKTGMMHGYMRMYWGKKILEWGKSPQWSFKTAIYLNDKYQLDGRDPNSYAGVAWCFGKHDRPWAKRPIFGNVRYMNDKGLKRKFDIDAYVEKIVNIS